MCFSTPGEAGDESKLNELRVSTLRSKLASSQLATKMTTRTLADYRLLPILIETYDVPWDGVSPPPRGEDSIPISVKGVTGARKAFPCRLQNQNHLVKFSSMKSRSRDKRGGVFIHMLEAHLILRYRPKNASKLNERVNHFDFPLLREERSSSLIIGRSLPETATYSRGY